MPERTILLIDYDPESIANTRRFLDGSGYRLEVANDGIAGLRAFERLRPDLVLIEPMVPKKHGFQVCQEIKRTEAGRNVPVVITTAFYKSRRHRSEAKDSYGCDDYLIKPVGQEQLLATCRKYLAAPQPVATVFGNTAQVGPEATAIPWAPAREKLPALDELSDDELAARLDEMILEDVEEAPAPPVIAPSPRPVVASPPVEVRDAPERPVAAADASDRSGQQVPARSLVASSPRPVVASPPVKVRDAPERQAPLQAAIPAPVSELGEVPDSGVPHATSVARTGPPVQRLEESKILSRPQQRFRGLPWIAAAGFALIAIGAGILWRIGPGADPRPAVERVVATESRSGHAGELRAAAVQGTVAAIEATVAEPSPEFGPDAPEPVPQGGPATGELLPRASASGTVPPLESDTSAPEEPAPPPSSTAHAARRTARPPSPGSAAQTTPSPPPAIEPPGSERTARVPPDKPAPVAVPPSLPPRSSEPPAPAKSETDRPGSETRATAGDSGGDSGGETIADSQTESVELRDVIEPAASESSPPAGEPAVEISAPAPVPAVRRGQLVDLGEVDRPPTPLERPAPVYPAIAQRLRRQGTVTLRVLVDETGKVVDVVVEQGVDARVLDRAAISAVKSWRYTPAEKGGVAVRVWIPEQVSFKL